MAGPYSCDHSDLLAFSLSSYSQDGSDSPVELIHFGDIVEGDFVGFRLRLGGQSVGW